MASETLTIAQPGWMTRWRTENESALDEWRRGLYRFRQSRLSVVGLAASVERRSTGQMRMR